MDDKNLGSNGRQPFILLGFGIATLAFLALFLLWLGRGTESVTVAAAPTAVPEVTVEPASDPASTSAVEPTAVPQTTTAPVPTKAPEATPVPAPATPTPALATPVPAPATAAPETAVSETAVSGPLLLDNDLSTGSTEFSAVTLNEELNRLLIADDENVLFEFELSSDGSPLVPPVRTLRVDAGAGDIEGLAWISGSTYALAHENDGRLTVVDLAGVEGRVTAEHVLRTVDTGIREDGGNGLEGVAYVRDPDPSRPQVKFVAVKERPPSLVLIDDDGQLQTVPLNLPVTDLSGVWMAHGEYTVVSDESRAVITFALDDDLVPVMSGRLDLTSAAGLFDQPEGVARSVDGRLYVVGEGPGPARYSFGLWPR